jgi:hypothetical protein
MRPAIRSQVSAMTSRSARPFSAKTVRAVSRHLAASCRYSSGLFIGSCRLAGGQPRVRNTRQCAPFPRESEPRHWNDVRGVQGRYFVIALPAAAVFIAALLNCELPPGVPAAIAIAGSMIAGITTVEGILRPHW